MIICAAFYGCQRERANTHRLGHVPEQLAVSKILYAKEKAYGFGPGGNEAGVIVYALSEEVATEIARTGLDFFKQFPPQSTYDRHWQGKYREWQETPLISDPDWHDDWDDELEATDTVLAAPLPKLENYLYRYGFGIEVNPDIEQEINSAISTSGSYFAYGRLGMLLVMPEAQKIVYVHSG